MGSGAVGEVVIGLKRQPPGSEVTSWDPPASHRDGRERVRTCCKDEWLAAGWTCYVANCSGGHASRAAPARDGLGGGAKPAGAAASAFPPGYKQFGNGHMFDFQIQ